MPRVVRCGLVQTHFDLDAKSASEVLTLLQRLNQEYKKTIVMVTHDPHAAERASRVLHLEKGSLIEQVQS